jgi:dGTPase
MHPALMKEPTDSTLPAPLYTEDDKRRRQHNSEPDACRSPFRRDYARLIHSSAFRRLQGKTQLFPGVESDFFRTRLAHSLEVAQIAKSIANRINEHPDYPGYFKTNKIDLDLVEFAGLAHDLGHPPFGHLGERALHECMRKHGGFEGNAQTLRILATLEKKEFVSDRKSAGERRLGLNLTYRSYAAILKYDRSISQNADHEKITKGYYESEGALVRETKKHVGSSTNPEQFRTIECQIMDIADDIAYSTYDFEDALKSEFLSPLDMMNASSELLETISEKIRENSELECSKSDIIKVLFALFKNIFEAPAKPEAEIISDKDGNTLNPINDPLARSSIATRIYGYALELGRNGELRTKFTSALVGEFIQGVEVSVDESNPVFSKVALKNDVLFKVEVLKHFAYEAIIMSPKLKVAEYRGKDIVREIFEKLSAEESKGIFLLPEDCQELYNQASTEHEKKRVICDFIAGMTDRYAIEFYERLTSSNAQSMFKPL